MHQSHHDANHHVGESKTCSELADKKAIYHRSTLKLVDTCQKWIMLCLSISEQVMCLMALPDPPLPPPHDGVSEFTSQYPLFRGQHQGLLINRNISRSNVSKVKSKLTMNKLDLVDVNSGGQG